MKIRATSYITNYKKKKWDEGIRSKSGFTRKAKALRSGDDQEIDNLIDEVLSVNDFLQPKRL
jgi:hypothetical protein